MTPKNVIPRVEQYFSFQKKLKNLKEVFLFNDALHYDINYTDLLLENDFVFLPKIPCNLHIDITIERNHDTLIVLLHPQPEKNGDVRGHAINQLIKNRKIIFVFFELYKMNSNHIFG